MSDEAPGVAQKLDGASAALEKGVDTTLDPVAVPHHTPGELRRIHGSVLHRFTLLERVVHWVVGITFILLLLTGLGFSYPRLYWMTLVLGGGSTARVLHPWVGLAFSAGILAMAVLWVGDMFLQGRDREWLKSIHHYIRHEKDKVPPVGKYNAGQKLYFWIQILLGAVFLISGLPLWFPQLTSSGVFNAARLVHYLAALAGGMSLIPHIYLGTIAFPGTLRSILYGTVTRAWARLHHPLWAEEEIEASDRA